MSIFTNNQNEKSPYCQHPTFPTAFCVYKSCNKALCSACLPTHSHPTNKQYIINIEEAQKFSLEKTQKYIEALKYELEKVHMHLSEIELEKANNEDFKLITRNRQNIKKIVKKFYENIEEECNKLLYNSFDLRINQLSSIEREIQMLHEKLVEISQGLSSKNAKKSVSKSTYIENCYNLDIKNELLRLSNDFKTVVQTPLVKSFEKLPEITSNIEFILKNVFHESLNLLLKAENTEEQSTKGKTNNKNNLLLTEKMVETSTFSSNFMVTVPDFFEKNCAHKCISYINCEKNTLYYMNLETPQSPSKSKTKFQKIKIVSPHELPFRHRSIILPDGTIFLIGGCYKSNNLVSNEALRFNWESKAFTARSGMQTPRKSFGLCFCKNFLFVLGGFNYDEGFLLKCEKYDILKDKWTSIEPCLSATSSPATCTFNSRFIYKFSGLKGLNMVAKNFERYDIENNQWMLFDIAEKNQIMGLSFLWLAAGIQINDHEIMFFGGVDEENQPSEQTFVVKVINDQLFRVTNVGTRNLKEKGGFWNSQTLVLNHSLYCLQNVENEKKKGEAHENKRNLVIFADFDWKNN